MCIYTYKSIVTCTCRALKIVTEDDIKMVPMVTGEGKRARIFLIDEFTVRGFLL